MKKEQNNINCPSCGTIIDINAIVYNQLSEQVKTDFGTKFSNEKKELETKLRKQISDERSDEISSYKEELERKTQ